MCSARPNPGAAKIEEVEEEKDTPKVEEVKSSPPKEMQLVEPANIERMADQMLEMMDSKKGTKTVSVAKAKAKAKAKGAHASKVLKKPASKKHVHPPKKDKSEPPFPGTERGVPIKWGSCTIYRCSDKWRVKVNPGEKKDFPKSFTSNPEEGWKAVIALCREKGTFDK